jgi:hypothetical protein
MSLSSENLSGFGSKANQPFSSSASAWSPTLGPAPAKEKRIITPAQSRRIPDQFSIISVILYGLSTKVKTRYFGALRRLAHSGAMQARNAWNSTLNLSMLRNPHHPRFVVLALRYPRSDAWVSRNHCHFASRTIVQDFITARLRT